ncbi:MAG TPA: hypothetical protein PKC58_17180 [Ignavibacteria bacterium]|nr:hypothetical protein [Ignavibacteria bacterium]
MLKNKQPWALIPLCLIVLNCKREFAPKSNEQAYKLEISDSMVIQLPLNIEFADYNETSDRFLFIAQGKVLETDRKGNIIHQFSPLGVSSEEIGTMISSIGYIDHSIIAIFTERGYFLFSKEGELLNRIEEKERYPNIIRKKIIRFNSNEKDWLVSSHKPFYNPDTVVNYNFGKPVNFYKDFRAVTLLDLNNRHTSLGASIPGNSIFLKKNNFNFLNFSFFFCKINDDLAVLFNPEKIVNIYSSSSENFKLNQQIQIEPAFFKSENKTNKNQADLGKSLAVNSNFTSIFARKDLLGITYSTGIPEDEYSQPTQGSLEMNLTELDARLNKRYLLLYRKGVKVCADLPFPEKMAGMITFTGSDEILVVPHAYWIEEKGSTKLYFCSIIAD